MCLGWAGVSAPAIPRWDAVLIEYFSDAVFPRIRKMGYQAIRTERWKYIHYSELENADELYDLQRDPYELHNRINDANAPKAALQAQLAALAKAL